MNYHMNASDFIRTIRRLTNTTYDEMADILCMSGAQTIRNKITRNSLTYEEFIKLVEGSGGRILITVPISTEMELTFPL